MEPLVYSLNAVLPLVALAALGYLLRRVGVVTGDWAKSANKLCFQVFLPLLLFMNIYNTDSVSDMSWGLAVFAAGGILAAFALGWLAVKLFVPERRQKGVVLQCVFRSNYAILGMPLAISLFGRDGGQMAAALSLFSIPMFNILSVVALQAYGGKGGRDIKGTLKDIIKNPLLIGIFAGIAVLLIRALFERMGIGFRLTDIGFLYSALNSASQIASPLMLIMLGAQFSFGAVKGLLKPITVGVAMRIVVVPALMLTTAYIFFPSFNGAAFAALIALFGSPVAVSSTVMAAEMGGDAELAGQLMVWSTLLSSVTIFVFVLVFRALGALT